MQTYPFGYGSKRKTLEDQGFCSCFFHSPNPGSFRVPGIFDPAKRPGEALALGCRDVCHVLGARRRLFRGRSQLEQELGAHVCLGPGERWRKRSKRKVFFVFLVLLQVVGCVGIFWGLEDEGWLLKEVKVTGGLGGRCRADHVREDTSTNIFEDGL